MRVEKTKLINGILLSAAVFLTVAVVFLTVKIFLYFEDAKRSDEISAVLKTAAVETSTVADSDGVRLNSETFSRFGAELLAAKDMNSDVVGWIGTDDTAVNYPVLKGDNNVYYLKHNLLGEASSRACIMLDAAMDINAPALLLYGHHMRDGSMFHDLVDYTDMDFLDRHPVIWFETQDGCMDYRIFAVLVDRAGTLDVRQQLLESADLTALFLSDSAVYYADAPVGGRLLVLTTCSYETNDAAIYIFASQE